MSDAHHQVNLDMIPDRALFEGHLSGLVVTCYENERPLNGLAGLVDWRFQGSLSQCLRAGAISGKVGECVYFPVTRHEKLYHIILIGGGFTSSAGERSQLPADAIKILNKNLASLRLSKIGVSMTDFGNVTGDYFSKQFKGVPLWIVQ